jgi:hypothetical protein
LQNMKCSQILGIRSVRPTIIHINKMWVMCHRNHIIIFVLKSLFCLFYFCAT